MATPEERRAAALESLRMRPRTDEERNAALVEELGRASAVERLAHPVMHVGGPVRPIILRCTRPLTVTERDEALAIIKQGTDYPVVLISYDWEVVG